jgi:UDP-N-acetylmuramate dehydrogenase
MLLKTEQMSAFVHQAVLQDVPLAPHTSLGLGGPAQYLARLTRPESLPAWLDWAARQGLPVTLLGGGTNVVVSDRGVPGLVLALDLLGESIVRDGDTVDVSVGAGEPWDAFVARSVERGWAGLECLSGIPGQVGATPIQNVGAYGQDVGGALVSVDVYDALASMRMTLARDDCRFAYRTSRFKGVDSGRFIVLGATFRLHAGGDGCIAYPEIARHFGAPGSPRPTPANVRRFVLETRRSKSMLLDPSDENGRSCGSFFLNPELTLAELDALRGRAPTAPPGFPAAGARIKVPAAWLIEHAGFRRGQRFGNVGISSRHALALVCHDGATAVELVAAAHRVRDGVARAFDVSLVPEPRFIGFDTPSDELPILD